MSGFAPQTLPTSAYADVPGMQLTLDAGQAYDLEFRGPGLVSQPSSGAVAGLASILIQVVDFQTGTTVFLSGRGDTYVPATASTLFAVPVLGGPVQVLPQTAATAIKLQARIGGGAITNATYYLGSLFFASSDVVLTATPVFL